MANGTPRPPPAVTVPKPMSRTHRSAAPLMFGACIGRQPGPDVRRAARRLATLMRRRRGGGSMRRFAQIGLLACFSALAGAAVAFDNGQYENVPADIRAWFRSVIAPSGVPCCDISD